MKKRIDKEYVIKYLNSFGYKLLSDYKNISSKITIICPSGHVYDTTVNSFKNKGRRCLSCKLKNKEDFIREYISKENYLLLDIKIKKNRTYVYIQCPNDHDPYWVEFSSFKTLNRRCKKCRTYKTSRNKSHDFEYVKNFISNLDYKLLSDSYLNQNEKLDIECDKGHIFKTTFKSIKNDHRCPICQRKLQGELQRTPYEDVKTYVESYGYKLLSTEYVDNYLKITTICPKGHRYDARFGNFKTGYRCSICNQSSGSSEVRRILEKLNINFKQEYKFKDCKFKSYLPFDFYLPDHNILIEFDGGQHYKIVDHFGGFDAFVELKIRDTIKNIYCEKNNIKLIRIPYWEFDNIETILMNEINEIN